MSHTEAPDLPSVALVVPWYGPLPPTFDPWLRSCAGNPSIDWLFFTDEDLSSHPVPPNIHHFPIDFHELHKLFEDRLEMDVCLTRPYHLCNFKIAYGWIFQQWLKEYEIWGHCDVDIVWGNLRKFFPPSLLRAYPKVQQQGHLTLYHNTEAVNRMFRQAHPDPTRNYRAVFTRPEVRGFDEWGGAHELAYLSGFEQYWMREYVDVDSHTHWLRGIRLHNYENQLFYWEDGSLYMEYVEEPGVDQEDSAFPMIHRDEFSHIHLQKRSMRPPNFDVANVRGFYVTPDAFIQKVKAEHCLNDFLLLNPRQATRTSTRRTSHAYGQAMSKLTASLKRLRR